GFEVLSDIDVDAVAEPCDLRPEVLRGRRRAGRKSAEHDQSCCDHDPHGALRCRLRSAIPCPSLAPIPRRVSSPKQGGTERVHDSISTFDAVARTLNIVSTSWPHIASVYVQYLLPPKTTRPRTARNLSVLMRVNWCAAPVIALVCLF